MMESKTMSEGLAVVTGASSGIGLELARCCAEAGYVVLICSDTEEIEAAARELRATGAIIESVQADLSTEAGVGDLVGAIGTRPVAALLANAGIGLGDGFLDQDLQRALRIVDVNVTGTLMLLHAVGRGMRARGEGRILITGSIAGFVPGSFHAIYNASKAFLDNFSIALANELKDTGVTVTCLMPGLTESDFFESADMEDTKLAQAPKADPADVARKGFEAMRRGDSGVVTGFMNKVQAAFTGIIPETILAQMHRRLAEPRD